MVKRRYIASKKGEMFFFHVHSFIGVLTNVLFPPAFIALTVSGFYKLIYPDVVVYLLLLTNSCELPAIDAAAPKLPEELSGSTD